uniref:Glycerol uptake facilitator family permease (AqpZ) n=1 Tax=uncultured marine group II/III euryarchaeote SAT1000_09_G02 TaxID=1456557 RepID=A0A075I759_9EURY|nr:Glycerol uptake facilitator family permease (aqpZ) [uncultured marine group II/III euryarchaeote SAT1000_09_G02]
MTTEFIGTFFLSLTICTAAVYGTAGDYAPFAIASTLMVMIYAGGHISGAHYNPAVTVSIYLRGACDKDEVLPYIASQIIAAVSAAFVVERLLLPDTLSPEMTDLGTEAIVAELLFTFALAYVILNVATTESTSDNGYYGAAIAFVVLAGAITVGSISLASFNPAVTSALIVSGKVSLADSWMHFVPQFIGAVLATYVYKSTQ